MAEQYNISALMQLAFGLTPKVAFNLPSAPSLSQVEQWAGQNGYRAPEQGESFSVSGYDASLTKQPYQSYGRENNAYYTKSWLGTPIWGQMKVKGGNLRRFDDRGELATISLNDFLLPPVTLCDIERERNIIQTPLLGGSGTVKEMYGEGDWVVRMRGLCLNEPGGEINSAWRQRLRLKDLASIIDPLEIQGGIFEFLELKECLWVVVGVRFGQLEGKPNVLPFEMNFISDRHPLLDN